MSKSHHELHDMGMVASSVWRQQEERKIEAAQAFLSWHNLPDPQIQGYDELLRSFQIRLSGGADQEAARQECNALAMRYTEYAETLSNLLDTQKIGQGERSALVKVLHQYQSLRAALYDILR